MPVALMLDDRVPMEEVEICEGTWSEVAASEGKDKAEVEGADDWAAPPGLGAEGWAQEEEGGKKRKEPQASSEEKDKCEEEAMAVVPTPLVVVTTPACPPGEPVLEGKGSEDWLSSPKEKEADAEIAEGRAPKGEEEQERKGEGQGSDEGKYKETLGRQRGWSSK